MFQLVPDFKSAVNYLFLGFGVLGGVGSAILSTVVSVPSGDTPPPPAGGEEEEGAPLAPRKVSDGGGDSGGEDGKSSPSKSDSVSLVETLRLAARNRGMQLLIPIIFYNGASLGFQFASFPLLYQDLDGPPPVLSLLPKAFVGYVSASFFLANSGFSFLWGKVTPTSGKRPRFVVVLLSHAVYFSLILALATKLLSVPHESAAAYALPFAIAVVFALGDSVLESQVPAIVQSPTFFGVERDRDAANSNVRMWQSLGFCGQFVLGIVQPGNVLLQAAVLIPLGVVALACVAVLDTCVRPIDSAPRGGKGEYVAVPEE